MRSLHSVGCFSVCTSIYIWYNLICLVSLFCIFFGSLKHENIAYVSVLFPLVLFLLLLVLLVFLLLFPQPLPLPPSFPLPLLTLPFPSSYPSPLSLLPFCLSFSSFFNTNTVISCKIICDLSPANAHNSGYKLPAQFCCSPISHANQQVL